MVLATMGLERSVFDDSCFDHRLFQKRELTLNILTDPWIPVLRLSGEKEKIAFSGLTSNYILDPVVELQVPRADFQNALYQLFIGILQVVMTPENDKAWIKKWESPPDPDELVKSTKAYTSCFVLDGEGPAFMQDRDLKEGEEKGISGLLIEAPGGKTVRENLDHFVKRDLVNQVDGYWAGVALYTLQTFAPAGGVGHRVGLRGGGPLTSLVRPEPPEGRVFSTLWEKLWINILPRIEFAGLGCDPEKQELRDIFPWMGATRISDAKGGETQPFHCHPFQAYFGMPRRIRLRFTNEKGACDLSGEESSNLVSAYITKNYGTNYAGPWKHPLNAYTRPKKPDEPALSAKGQPGGVTYKHWLDLALLSESKEAALIVRHANRNDAKGEMLRGREIRLWVAGYDMDNMKARCWYEATMPLFSLPAEQSSTLQKRAANLINMASEVAFNTRRSVKSAWYANPAEAPGDPVFLDKIFWERTENYFYDLLKQLARDSGLDSAKGIDREWHGFLTRHSLQIFDQNVLGVPPLGPVESGLEWKRIIKARNTLSGYLNGEKFRKNFLVLA